MKRLIVLFMLLVAFIVGWAITVPVDATQDYPLKIWKQNENGRYTTLVVVDDITGVNYVVVNFDDVKGDGLTMCPRYNADGSLYVSE